MRILLTGASGFLGKHITRALLWEGHAVTACVRRPGRLRRQFPHVTELVCDFSRDLDAEDWYRRLEGIDAVINAVGIISEHGGNRFEDLHTRAPIALFSACQQAGVNKVIQISALGADDKATSAYHLTKRAADDYLEDSQLDWTILRPSVVMGRGGQSTAFFCAMASLPIVPLVAGGEQKIQPVAIENLVTVILAALQDKKLCRQILDVVGSEPMTFQDFLAQQRAWLGLGKAWFVSIPYWLAMFAGTVVGALGSVILNRETVMMLQRGNCADVSQLIKATGLVPRSVKGSLAAHPATVADVWYAELYFMGPVLRFSIAFVWVVTGLVSVWGYPIEDSYALLGQVGLPNVLKPIALYSAAMLDTVFGFIVLINWRPRLTALSQIVVILTYMAIIAIAIPEQWLHPFGPITKNVPMIVAIWITAILSERR